MNSRAGSAVGVQLDLAVIVGPIHNEPGTAFAYLRHEAGGVGASPALIYSEGNKF